MFVAVSRRYMFTPPPFVDVSFRTELVERLINGEVRMEKRWRSVVVGEMQLRSVTKARPKAATRSFRPIPSQMRFDIGSLPAHMKPEYARSVVVHLWRGRTAPESLMTVFRCLRSLNSLKALLAGPNGLGHPISTAR